MDFKSDTDGLVSTRSKSSKGSLAKNTQSLGILLVVSFLVLANANAVFAGNLLQTIHPFTFLFWSFSACAIFFLLRLRTTEGRNALAVDRASVMPLLIVNGTTAFNWVGYFFALKFIEPAIVSAIMGGVGPLFMIGLERAIRHRVLPPTAYVAAVGILLGACSLVWASLSGLSGMENVSLSAAIIGLSAATLGGASQALNTLATKQLGERNWNADKIMAHRFYLLIVGAFLLALTGPGLNVSTLSQVGGISISTIFGVIVPLWLLQRGILISEPFAVAALLSLAPILTYLFQGFDNRIAWSGVSLAGCIVVVVFTVLSIKVKHKETYHE